MSGSISDWERNGLPYKEDLPIYCWRCSGELKLKRIDDRNILSCRKCRKYFIPTYIKNGGIYGGSTGDCDICGCRTRPFKCKHNISQGIEYESIPKTPTLDYWPKSGRILTKLERLQKWLQNLI